MNTCPLSYLGRQTLLLRQVEVQLDMMGWKWLFFSFLLATTKHINTGTNNIGIHLSYLYNRRKDYSLNGLAGGITYSTSNIKGLNLIVEYDSKDIVVGANYLLLKHLLFQAMLQRGKYFSGGLTYLIHLK